MLLQVSEDELVQEMQGAAYVAALRKEEGFELAGACDGRMESASL